MFSTLSPLAGYSTSRFIILGVLGLVSFACAAPLQPEPTRTATPSLATFTLKPSSSSSSLSSSPSTITPLPPSFVPRTNPEPIKNSNSKPKTFTIHFRDTTSNNNQFIQQPIQQLLAHANIQVSSFIGTPNTEDEKDYNFYLLDPSGMERYYGEIWDEHHEIDKAAKPGYHYDGIGLGGRLSVERIVKGKVELTEVFEVRKNKITVNELELRNGEKAL
ncbi:hypothetical protein F5050DRAFT_1811594 [Lentinula boryana]|uniref:Uncharacterized protein n=1 Tax=Lentinula boryana TaxID=40481 RepID=A0ABQ8Q3B1_9AGAR|nr:hypothetical protein F5050DRAFT_1811594 [Lentinula boryana]